MKLSECTPAQLHALAEKVGGRTTYNSLRHVARGRRGVSADKAILIERAARDLGLDLRREDMSTACGGCEFATRCRARAACAQGSCTPCAEPAAGDADPLA